MYPLPGNALAARWCYAYLQMGQDEQAKKLVDEVQAMATALAMHQLAITTNTFLPPADAVAAPIILVLRFASHADRVIKAFKRRAALQWREA
jgi:hypothetical protein